MSKKAIIAIVIIAIVIIIGVVGFLIYRNNKKKKDLAAQQQMAILQQQLQGNVPPAQRASLLSQIADIAAQIQGGGTPPFVPANTGSGSVSTTTPNGFPLRKGSDTSKAPINYVQGVQIGINAKCGKKLVSDGKFGPLTESAAISCLGTPTVSWQQYQKLAGVTD